VSAVHLRGDRVRLPDVGQSREGRQVRHRDLPIDDLQKTKIVSARKTKTFLAIIVKHILTAFKASEFCERF
jgi:hypothetical protein